MKTTQRLYEAAHPIWEQCCDHPFVRGIADGSLELEKFRWFLLQDYLYLFDYARVFAWGVIKARDPDLMRTFSANVDAILGGEMKIHRAYMERLGITEEQVFAVRPALSNTSYTNYMLSCAAAGGTAEIIAAILSCSWSYAEIGARLAAIPGAADHPFYGEWVRGYAGEDYQRTNDALVELMDQSGGGLHRGGVPAAGGDLRQLQPVRAGLLGDGLDPGAVTMAMLEFQNVSYQYPSEDFDIIDRLSFSVEPGSFHCIIGVSGCGKSTIFRMTNGLLKPKGGTILVGGAPIAGGSATAATCPRRICCSPGGPWGRTWRCPWRSGAACPARSGGTGRRRPWPMWVWPAAPTRCPMSSPAGCGSGRPSPGPC